MISLKDIMSKDNTNIFLNSNEFAEEKTLSFGGKTFYDIPVIITNVKEKDRNVSAKSDHIQGLFVIAATLHCTVAALEFNIPEKGQRISIKNKSENYNFTQDYYVASIGIDGSMLCIELEAISE